MAGPTRMFAALRSNVQSPPRLRWHTWLITPATLAALMSTLVAPAMVATDGTDHIYMAGPAIPAG